MTDAELETYELNLDRLSDTIAQQNASAHEQLEHHLAAKSVEAEQLIRVRTHMISGADRERVSGLLPTGLFRHLPLDQRIAAFLVSLDLADRAERRSLRSRFAKYQCDMPLFAGRADLLANARNLELIDFKAMGAIRGDGIVSLSSGFGRLDPMLPASLVQTMATAYAGKPLFVRLDPQQAWKQRPQQVLMETTLVPANPYWWRTLALHARETTGGKYELIPPTSPAENLGGYWEYHAKGIRRLETIAQRKKADHLTFMLEELQEVRPGLLIGRCIHLDTSAAAGTSPAVARVLHADLAINVYEGTRVIDRIGSDLRTGKVDATFRTHLLRVENVPFEVAALWSHLFFVSRELRRDLFADQFKLVEA
jgi:hypothetical protein